MRRATREEVRKATQLQRLINPTDEQVEELVEFFRFLRKDGVRFGNVPVGKYKWPSPLNLPDSDREEKDRARIVLMRDGSLRCVAHTFQGKYFGHASNPIPYIRQSQVERFQHVDDALAWVDSLTPDEEDGQFEDGVDE